jgi:hypothetical protein
MSYSVIESDFQDHISVSYNNEGAIVLTALVQDPNDVLSNIGPFYHDNVFYFYELHEAIELFISKTLNDDKLVFVVEDDSCPVHGYAYDYANCTTCDSY